MRVAGLPPSSSTDALRRDSTAGDTLPRTCCQPAMSVRGGMELGQKIKHPEGTANEVQAPQIPIEPPRHRLVWYAGGCMLQSCSLWARAWRSLVRWCQAELGVCSPPSHAAAEVQPCPKASHATTQGDKACCHRHGHLHAQGIVTSMGRGWQHAWISSFGFWTPMREIL